GGRTTEFFERTRKTGKLRAGNGRVSGGNSAYRVSAHGEHPSSLRELGGSGEIWAKIRAAYTPRVCANRSRVRARISRKRPRL
ncbi:hypothetical protein, partial [Treponema endosymbiont of Eucomonympha sp.]|uniref:hypothetical protein n=1 Tax=Treponema endosymbiont of Eucomonympha sp. TaxID=1580831 RepID=UPI001EE70C6B